ncbi:MAG: hypothetical protein K2N32_01160, partial [Clostridia bacterium]|nr:hypothetical protein [Clostridia bacterium]
MNGKILNCHTQGVMSRTTNTPNQVYCGGISGGSHRPDVGESKSLHYRCSAKFSVSGIDTGKDVFCGGIIGMVWHAQAITILDCHSEYTTDAPRVVIPYYMGAIAGLLSEVSEARIENCTAKFNPTPNIGSTGGGLYAGIFPIYSQKVVCQTANTFNIKVKNVYFQSENDSYTFYPVTAWSTIVSHLDSTISVDVNNIQYVKSHAYDPLVVGIETKYINGSCTAISDMDTMWNNAKATSSPLTNSIWDKNKINSTYSIENSPVINSLVKTQFNVEFVNYKTSGDVSLGINDIKYDGGTSLALPTASGADSNHKFVGWTTDKSGESGSFTAMPSNMYG